MKKIPLRKCVGCKKISPKKSLIRIVKDAQGDISIDLTGKKNGRGAYICKNLDCLAAAFKKKQLDYSFKCKVDETVYQSLKEEFGEKEKGGD